MAEVEPVILTLSSDEEDSPSKVTVNTTKIKTKLLFFIIVIICRIL